MTTLDVIILLLVFILAVALTLGVRIIMANRRDRKLVERALAARERLKARGQWVE